jgi:hypothetical protein
LAIWLKIHQCPCIYKTITISIFKKIAVLFHTLIKMIDNMIPWVLPAQRWAPRRRRRRWRTCAWPSRQSSARCRSCPPRFRVPGPRWCWKKEIWITMWPGVDVMITIFCDFCPFSTIKISVFLKNQCYDHFFKI